MPLPVAHSAAGLAGYLVFKKAQTNTTKSRELAFVGLCLFLSTVQDIDFLPGFMIGDIGRFHHGPSHSLFVSTGLAILMAMFAMTWLKGIGKKRIFAACMISSLSHPVLDYFSEDTSVPYGVPLFWPFDIGYYISPFALFMDVRRNQDSIFNFFKSLINRHNGMQIVIESFFAGLILFAILGTQNRSRLPLSLLYFFLSFLCGFFYWKLRVQH